MAPQQAPTSPPQPTQAPRPAAEQVPPSTPVQTPAPQGWQGGAIATAPPAAPQHPPPAGAGAAGPTRAKVIASLVAILLVASIGSTAYIMTRDGGGDPDDPNDPDGPDGPDGPGGPDEPAEADPRFPGFDFELSEGTFWKFACYTEKTTSGSGTSRTTEFLRISLGAPITISGTEAYEVRTSGAGRTLKWRYLALEDGVLMGSRNGTELKVIVDAFAGNWTGGGFFISLSGEKSWTLANTSFTSDYVDTSCYGVATYVGEGGSTYYAEIGQTIHDPEQWSQSEREYYKGGLGPIGYYYSYEYSYSSGMYWFFTSTRTTISLVDSSLRADDGYELSMDSSERDWKEASFMDEGITGATAASVGDRVYLFGGFSTYPVGGALAPVPVTGNVSEYDPASDTWRNGTHFSPMPTPRWGATSEVVDGKVYVIGGLNATWDIMNIIEVYDIDRDSWGTVEVPEDVIVFSGLDTVVELDGELAIVFLQKYLYSSQDTWTMKVKCYFPGRNAWEGRGVWENARDFYDLVSVDDVLYGVCNDTVERFDFSSTRGTKVAFEHNASNSGNKKENKCFVLGDVIYNIYFGQTYSFDTTSNETGERGDLNRERKDVTVAVDGGRAYVFGGYWGTMGVSGFRTYENVEWFEP